MSDDRVSLRDIYEAVGSLEKKMEDRLEKIDTRVTRLESLRDRALGMVAVFSVFITLAANFIWEKLTGN